MSHTGKMNKMKKKNWDVVGSDRKRRLRITQKKSTR